MFGEFTFICNNAAIPLCSLVGPYDASTSVFVTTGILPKCFARSIELANTLIFQVGNAFINIAAILVCAIIIYNIRSKYTAIGRLEILHVFFFYLILTVISLVIDSGVVPARSGSYPWFVAIQAGVSSAVCCALMVNGFLGFQFYEDGTKKSVWGLRLASFLMFAVTFAVAILTFKSWTPGVFSPSHTTGLFVMMYVLCPLFIAVYVVSQLVLIIAVLHDLWALGAFCLGLFFFAVGQVLLYAFSSTICGQVKHYLDGLFFASLCNLFGMMMVYKYWDMITKEDLEFSVSNKENSWEVKELLDNQSEYGSEYNLNRAF